MTKSRGILPPRKIWNEAELRSLARLYPDHSAADIAERLGVSVAIVYARAHSMGLKKSEAFQSSPASGRMRPGSTLGTATRFKAGSVPPNKGLRRPGWAPGRMAETQFKKGRAASEAHNYLPIGSERLSEDGYLERKVTDDPALVPARRWVAVHRLLWIEVNGSIPDGHLVEFRDGDKTHIAIDNLELVSRVEHMRRHTVHNLPPELAQVVQLKGALQRRINKLESQREEQD